MNIHAWAERMPKEFWQWGSVNAYPRNAERYCAVLDSVQGMTTPSTMHLLNLAAQHMGPNECYLEVGTWRGATLIGALLGNDAYGVAIDDDSMNEHDGDERKSEDVWYKNVMAHDLIILAQYINGSVPSVFEPLDIQWPIGVYFFDGDK